MTPRLRFPQFISEWPIKTLGDIAKITTGRKDTQDRVDDGEYPFFVRSDTVERIDTFSYDGEAILTSGDGVGVGRNFHYIRGKFDFHQRVYAIRDFSPSTNGRYVYEYFAANFYSRVIKMSAKNSVDSVRMDMISKMPIPYPSKLEQDRIAKFLTAVDERIALMEKKLELLKKYKKGVMQKIFTQQIRFKDENGDLYPDWEEKKLGEVLKIGSGRDYKHLKKGDIPVYGTGGLMLHVNDYLYDGKSICIGRKGTIDKPQFLSGKFWTVDTLFYTYDYKNSVPEFVYLIFQKINWQKYNEASGVPSLSKTTIEKIKINMPSEEEQRKITAFTTVIDNKIELESKKLRNAKKFKKSLLQRMFV